MLHLLCFQLEDNIYGYEPLPCFIVFSPEICLEKERSLLQSAKMLIIREKRQVLYCGLFFFIFFLDFLFIYLFIYLFTYLFISIFIFLMEDVNVTPVNVAASAVS